MVVPREPQLSFAITSKIHWHWFTAAWWRGLPELLESADGLATLILASTACARLDATAALWNDLFPRQSFLRRFLAKESYVPCSSVKKCAWQDPDHDRNFGGSAVSGQWEALLCHCFFVIIANWLSARGKRD
jgi:hypothetical protein